METSPTGAIGRQTWIQLVAIVFLASILRVWGLAYCLPHPIGRPDEQVTTFNALRMFANRTLAPGDWWYPSLQKYLAVGALQVHYAIARLTGRCGSLEEFVEYVTIIHPGLYYLTCRAVSVLTGVATVPVAFLLGRRVVGAADVVLMVFHRGRAIGGTVVLLLCALPTLWRSIQFDRVAGRPDTRVAAADWIAANVPAQSRIALCEGYGAPVLHGNRPGRTPFLPKTITCSRSVINSSRADYLVTHEHPVLRFSAPVGHYEALLDGRWQPVASFDPRSGAAIQRTDYDPSDAFYVPYTNLEAVTRGGPLITVWARSEAAGHPFERRGEPPRPQ